MLGRQTIRDAINEHKDNDMTDSIVKKLHQLMLRQLALRKLQPNALINAAEIDVKENVSARWDTCQGSFVD